MIKPQVPVMSLPALPRRARAFSGGRVDVSTAGSAAQVEIYGEIGFDGVTSAGVRQWLGEIGQRDVSLTLNSGGGDVFEGVAIYNDLAALPGKVTVTITGLAASAASVIAMAGDHIVMMETSMMMLHNSWTPIEGDRHLLQHVIGVLEKNDQSMATIYAARTGQPAAKIREMMDAETWLSPQEALALGFADEVRPAGPVSPPAGDLSRVIGSARPRGRSEAFLKELRAARERQR